MADETQDQDSSPFPVSDQEPEEEAPEPVDRSRDLLEGARADSPIRKHLDKLFSDIARGFQDQAERSDMLDDLWDLYHCVLNEKQFYNGNAQIFVPIIRDAINARATRFVNQLFPASGRYIDCTSSDGSQPAEIMALASHYIQKAKLKTKIVKPLLRAGDIEGHYNLYVDWDEAERQIVSRETHGIRLPPQGAGESEIETPDDDIDDVTEETIVEGRPVFEVLHDSDVLVLPATADSIDEALAGGGSVTIVRRWSKDMLGQMVDSGEILESMAGDKEDREAYSISQGLPGMNDTEKELVKAVGVRSKGAHWIVFEVWTMLRLTEKKGRDGETRLAYSDKGDRRLCRVWFAIDRRPLGAKRNPYWNDRCPLLSEPVEKVAGVFKGKSQIEALAPLQYEANDAANERADADHYGAMPIIMRKPSGSNAPLILNLAAVWEVDPADIKFAEFPDLSQRSMARIMAATSAIFQSLSVNPSMLPQQSTGSNSKANQARVAQEQSVDLLTTAESVSVVDEGILTPLAAWIVDLDHQYRDRELTVRAYGEMGVRAQMIDVPVLQNRTRYFFTWCGAEQARLNVAMQQQGTALINVARGMRQDLMQEGMQLRLAPALERAFINVFGPMTGNLMLRDMRRELSNPPDLENWMLDQGHEVFVHPLDNDPEHLKAHQQDMQEHGDPHGNKQVHVRLHLQSMQMKTAQLGQQLVGAQGVPGGSGPGVAGTPPGGVPQGGMNRAGAPPRMGAQPAGPRLIKGPVGAIPPDQMNRAGAAMMPRKF